MPTPLKDYETLAEHKLAVVDCYADWCGPCKMIAPEFAKMEHEFPAIKFYKVNVEEEEGLAADLGVTAMPTFFFFKGGKKVDELVGANKDEIRAKLQNLK